ncbi:hypothetical protein ZYZZX_17 [Hafnia phage vB_HpaM_Zyzzx]|uniref:Uncharacterized protein n=1 Tax=Hafnia phage vB_HpaM_Zyzzx TaxID=2836109 RepID=A0AAE7W9E2_9CAUD|nr:hypothetical protein ZYZZX_17 [Hafnia phage vB_HpaM_Zyzzx]
MFPLTWFLILSVVLTGRTIKILNHSVKRLFRNFSQDVCLFFLEDILLLVMFVRY